MRILLLYAFLTLPVLVLSAREGVADIMDTQEFETAARRLDVLTGRKTIVSALVPCLFILPSNPHCKLF